MSIYNVTLVFDASNSIEVEASSPEEAAQLAYDSDEASLILCHQCSRQIEIGDCNRAIVYDKDCSNELLDDGYEAKRIAELEAENAALRAQIGPTMAVGKAAEE